MSLRTYSILGFLLFCCGLLAVPPDYEVRRIQKRLQLIEELLSGRNSNHLTTHQLANRTFLLNKLNQYWRLGQFPKNTGSLSVRVPFFIDQFGTPCAVAFLMIESGRRDLAERIARANNNVYADLIEEPEFLKWADHWGFEKEELVLIQPSYAPGVKTDLAKWIEAKDFEKLKQLFQDNKPTADQLITAIVLDSVATVKWYLSMGADPNASGVPKIWVNDYQGGGGRSIDIQEPPLSWIINVKNLETAEALIKAGAKVDFKSEGKDILFFLLSQYYSHLPSYLNSDHYRQRNEFAFKYLQFLLDHGANVNAVAEVAESAPWNSTLIRNGTVLDVAMCRKDERLISLFRKYGGKELAKACIKGMVADVLYNEAAAAIQKDQCDDLKRQLRSPQKSQFTGRFSALEPLLHVAIENKKLECVKALLEAGVDPNELSNQREVPLVHAVNKGAPEIIKVLLKNKADPTLVMFIPDRQDAAERAARDLVLEARSKHFKVKKPAYYRRQ